MSVLSSFQYLQVPPKARNALPTTLSKKTYNIMGNEGFKRLARDGYFYKAQKDQLSRCKLLQHKRAHSAKLDEVTFN